MLYLYIYLEEFKSYEIIFVFNLIFNVNYEFILKELKIILCSYVFFKLKQDSYLFHGVI